MKRINAAMCGLVMMNSSVLPAFATQGNTLTMARQQHTENATSNDNLAGELIKSARTASHKHGVALMSSEQVATLKKARADLASLAVTQQRSGSARGSLRLIIDALLSETEAGYRARIDSLPVKVVKINERTVSGAMGVRTEYRLNGVVRGARPAVAGENQGESSIKLTDDFSYLEGGEHGPFALNGGKTMDCTFTDADNVYWSGTCATQQEIDDTQAMYYSMDAEASDYQAEGDQAWNDCADCYDAQSTWDHAFAGPSADDAFPSAENPLLPPSCIQRGVVYAAGLVVWFGAAAKICLAMNAGFPPSAPLVDAVALGTAALVGLTLTSLAFGRCVYQGIP